MHYNLNAMIIGIFNFVKSNGRLVYNAQNGWQMDLYELNGVSVGLTDDGYSHIVYWGERLRCNHTVGRGVEFTHGDETDLEILFNGLMTKE